MQRIMRKKVNAASTLLEVLEEGFPDSSRTTLRQMLQIGRVRVNGAVEKNARRALERGDAVEVTARPEVRLPPELTLLHEDDDVIVVIKAIGLLSVPTERNKESDTAQNYLNEYVRQKENGRIHVVHRLDRDTSGVMMFAKNFKAKEALKERFAEHDIDRIYVAVVEGKMNPPRGTIQSNLVERKDLKMVTVKHPHKNAKFAVTHYNTVESNRKYSMLEVTLETGRKNQIRTHLAEAGHPIIGDRLYGSEVNPIGRLALHAKLLGFDHPATGKHLTFEAPIPASFRKLFRS